MFEAMFEKAFQTLIKKEHITHWGSLLTRSHTENLATIKAYCAGARLLTTDWDFINWGELTEALVEYIAN